MPNQKGWYNNVPTIDQSISITDYLQKEEKASILRIIDKQNLIEHELITKLLLNGVRVSEVVGRTYYSKNAKRYGKRPYNGIQKEDIHFDKYTMEVKGKNTDRKKNSPLGKWRTVGVKPSLLRSLDTYIKTKKIGKGISIFNRPKEKPKVSYTPTAVYLFTINYGKLARLGRPLHPHMYRHTWAIEALFDGASLVSIKDQLGHSNINTTVRMYLKVAPVDRISEFMEKLEGWKE